MNELQQEVPVRDALDGGFAVVDRERLIEEETRVQTPWYKHFINSLVAPTKMMEENFALEPVKGVSVGVVGAFIFTPLTIFLQHLNPIIKEGMYDALRKSGVAEEMIQQQYMVKLVVNGLVGIMGIVLIVFIEALLLQIIKAIAKDKCKFASLFTMLFVCFNIVMALQTVDFFLANMIGVGHGILNVGSFFSEEALKASPKLSALASSLSLGEALRLTYMVIGYKILTHVTTKKAILVCGIFEVITIGVVLLLV